MSSLHRFVAICLPAAAMLAGCAGGASRFAPVLDTARRVTAEITQDGGTIEATTADGRTVKLVVPPGALVDPVTIAVTPVLSIGGWPTDGDVVAAVDLQPDGLRFQRPATLTLQADRDLTGLAVTGFTYAGDGTSLHAFPASFAGHDVTMTLMHFSGYGAAGGRAGDLATPGLDDVASVEQAAASQGDGSIDPATLFSSMRGWYRNSIRPVLVAAETDDGRIDDASASYGSFDIQVQNVEGAEAALATELAEARQLFVADLHFAIDQANARCRANNDWEMARNVFRCYTIAMYWNLDSTGNLLDLATLAAGLCVKVRFNSATISPQVSDTEPAQVKVNAVYVLNEGAPRLDPRIALALSCNGCDEHEASGTTDANGDWQRSIHLEPNADAITVEIKGTLVPLLGFGGTTITLATTGKLKLELQVKPFGAPDGELTADLCTTATEAQLVARTFKGRRASPSQSVQFTSANPDIALASPSASSGPDGVATMHLSLIDRPHGTIGATWSYDNSTAVASVEVKAKGIDVTPAGALIAPGGTQQYSATGVCIASSAATWSATGGTIDGSGLYTAGTVAGSYQVTASSTVDASLLRSVPVTVAGGACGTNGLQCCANATCTEAGTACGAGNLCVACGGYLAPCCTDGTCTGYACIGGTCSICGEPTANGCCTNGGGECPGNTTGLLRCDHNTGTCMVCGEVGHPCCTGSTCFAVPSIAAPDGGGNCSNDVCVACGARGQPCCTKTQTAFSSSGVYTFGIDDPVCDQFGSIGCCSWCASSSVDACDGGTCSHCGDTGEACCATSNAGPDCRGKTCTQSLNVCSAGKCTHCGSSDEPCCAGTAPWCSSGYMCCSPGTVDEACKSQCAP